MDIDACIQSLHDLMNAVEKAAGILVPNTKFRDLLSYDYSGFGYTIAHNTSQSNSPIPAKRPHTLFERFAPDLMPVLPTVTSGHSYFELEEKIGFLRPISEKTLDAFAPALASLYSPNFGLFCHFSPNDTFRFSFLFGAQDWISKAKIETVLNHCAKKLTPVVPYVYQDDGTEWLVNGLKVKASCSAGALAAYTLTRPEVVDFSTMSLPTIVQQHSGTAALATLLAAQENP